LFGFSAVPFKGSVVIKPIRFDEGLGRGSMKTTPVRHAREGGHPGFFLVLWIPACAGMTGGEGKGTGTETWLY